jgi:hypothetical protein
MCTYLAEMGEVLLMWGKLNCEKKISANLNSKVSCKFKNIVAVYLNRLLERRNALEAPIIKITFCLLHHGENTNREEEPRKDASKQGSQNMEESTVSLHE